MLYKMNKIKRLNMTQLKALGGIGNTRDQLVKNVEKLYTRLDATDFDDFMVKSEKSVPKLMIKPTNERALRAEIREIFNVKYLRLNEYMEVYDNYIANMNFDEIERIARNHDGWITYENNDGELVYYHLNEQNRQTLRDKLSGIQEGEFEQGSDRDFFAEIVGGVSNIVGVDIKREKNLFLEGDEVTNINATGGFLLKGHKLPFDLSRYGLFRIEQEVKDYHKNNCLYHAFKAGGMSDEKLEALKVDFYQRDISMKSLKLIAEKLDIQIKLSKCHDKNNSVAHYGNSKEKYNIALLEGHYFINEGTDYTSYVLENFDDVKHLDNYMNIVSKSEKGYERKNGRGINSKRVLEIVLSKYSYTINKMDVINTVYHHKIKSRVVNLDYLLNFAREVVSDVEIERKNNLNSSIVEKKGNKKVLRVFFDFETVVSDKNVSKRKLTEKDNYTEEFTQFEHRPREVTWIYGNTVKYASGYNCGEEFIKYVLAIKGYDQVHLIAHNAGFDFNFIARYLPNLDVCKIGSRFIYAEAHGKNSKIYVKDSYAFIASPLKDFNKIFAIPESKGYFDHSWIKYDNLDENGLVIDKWIDADENVPKEYVVNGKFDVNEYSKIYNTLDVKVLQQGYNKFGEWCNDLGINIDTIYTASSLAKKYAEKEGCFINCYELSGIPQAFISQAICGGRVMTQENKMIKVDDNIGTLDANSLYPSAMVSMEGFIKGRPKVIKPEQLNMDFLSKQSYYFVDIIITKVGKFLKMPLLAERLESSINYTNDMVGKTITVGKIYLEDLVNFQKIEYKLVRGYYFNDGFNTSIRDVIKNLYDTRSRLKEEGNPAEMVYKLIMNSIYGKCLQKPRDKKTVIKESKKDMLKYINRNETNIECAEQMAGCDKWIIREYKEINNDYNFVHIGGHILDVSKRIMNEVITLAEENDMDIYYTDTDSTHLKVADIEPLSNKYEERYGKKLIGEKLLQFKQDFGKDKNKNELYATKAIFLGKKTYIDMLNDGSVKAKAKGITKKALYYNGTTTPRTNEELYQVYLDRYNGKEQIFDLTCGGAAFTAKQKSNYTFVNINNFRRKF